MCLDASESYRISFPDSVCSESHSIWGWGRPAWRSRINLRTSLLCVPFRASLREEPLLLFLFQARRALGRWISPRRIITQKERKNGKLPFQALHKYTKLRGYSLVLPDSSSLIKEKSFQSQVP